MVNRRFARGVVVLGILAAAPAVAPAEERLPDRISFNQHVRPILSNNCFYCHGPDPKHREADLRLDEREGAILSAIVPGKPDESELLRRVMSDDEHELMPPPASKRERLTPHDVAILRRWIEQGAEYEGHWAFLPLRRQTVPAVQDESASPSAIDRFIQARLEAEQIKPSDPADRATLIRRVSLDLTGLVPSPAEVNAFLEDRAPDAYERLVDRLLASPHFGERWGRHWLDQARYADSNGYTIDSERAMWPFRDWVIQALNDDLPFDQFTIEQLAGDLLPDPTKKQLVATAFHRNTLINEEGGTDKEQFRHEAVVDRVNTTSAVWLGLTVACAQCHTHKFDPISHREYYELFAFFNSASDVNNRGEAIAVMRGEMFGQPVAPKPSGPDPEDTARRQAAWEARELARLDGVSASKVAWSPLEYVEYETKGGASFQRLDDNSLLQDGRAAPKDRYRIVARSKLEDIQAVRLRVLTHESLPKNGPGTASNGNFVLTDFNFITAGQKRPFQSAFADHEQPDYPIAAAIDENAQTGWAINVGPNSKGKMNANHEAVFILEKPLFVPADQTVEFTLSHELNDNYLIGRLAIDVAETAPAEPLPYETQVVEALTTPRDKRTREQARLVAAAFAKSEEQREARKKESTTSDTAQLMIMKELDKPRETYVALRGDFLRPDKEVGPLSPGGLHVVSPALPAEPGRTRLDLARWLVSPENALTPRVTTNRLWMRYFGKGLVETEEDFGTQGTPPSHPELLDWLAAEFIRRGWSQKDMHRRIVTSAAYRRSSHARPDLAEKDPRNLLLARQERLRIEAEVVRDAALAASGLLDRTLGGPSVRPPQPEGVYAFTQNSKRWVAETGSQRYRRGMYTAFFRSAPYPLFTTFDAPDFQSVCTRRLRSNTPLQALTVANDLAFVEIAQGLAARVLSELPESNVADRLNRAFLLALARPPSDRELSVLQGFFSRQADELAMDQERAQLLLSAEIKGLDASPAEAGAMVLACRAILNTDSFITRE
jgi:hypothetical protein